MTAMRMVDEHISSPLLVFGILGFFAVVQWMVGGVVVGHDVVDGVYMLEYRHAALQWQDVSVMRYYLYWFAEAFHFALCVAGITLAAALGLRTNMRGREAE